MAQYRIGLVSTTANNNTVLGSPDSVGNSPQWDSFLSPGDFIVIGEDEVAYEIANVVDDTEIELVVNYPTTRNDVPYFAVRDFTVNLDLPLISPQDIRWTIQYNKAVAKIDAAINQLGGGGSIPEVEIDDLVIHDKIEFRNPGSGAFSGYLEMPTFTGDRNITLPDASGTLVTSGELGTLAFENASGISVNLVPSGTRELGTDSNRWERLRLSGGSTAPGNYAIIFGPEIEGYGIAVDSGSLALIVGGDRGYTFNGSLIGYSGTGNPNIGNGGANRFGTFYGENVNLTGSSAIGSSSSDEQTLRGQIKLPDATSVGNAFLIGNDVELYRSAAGVLYSGKNNQVAVLITGSVTNLTQEDSFSHLNLAGYSGVNLPTNPDDGTMYSFYFQGNFTILNKNTNDNFYSGFPVDSAGNDLVCITGNSWMSLVFRKSNRTWLPMSISSLSHFIVAEDN